MSRALRLHAALALTLAVAPVATVATANTASLESTRALAAGLRQGGRAEVTLRWSAPGAPGAPASRMRGALAIEPPDRARLDVASTGERITLRADGGEWLQPGLHQLVLLRRRHSIAAIRWWRLLAGGEPARERRLEPRTFRLVLDASGEMPADSAEVSLDPAGLPARLVLDDGAGGRQVYALSGWRFTRARGAAAFHVEAPPGTETVELP